MSLMKEAATRAARGVTQPVNPSPGQAQADASIVAVDVEGHLFDPAKHRVKPDGTPIIQTIPDGKGGFKKRLQRIPGRKLAGIEGEGSRLPEGGKAGTTGGPVGGAGGAPTGAPTPPPIGGPPAVSPTAVPAHVAVPQLMVGLLQTAGDLITAPPGGPSTFRGQMPEQMKAGYLHYGGRYMLEGKIEDVPPGVALLALTGTYLWMCFSTEHGAKKWDSFRGKPKPKAQEVVKEKGAGEPGTAAPGVKA